MLKSDVIYNSSFEFRDINLNNVNDIYFAIDIIVIIITMLLKAFIVVVFIFEFNIVIVVNVNIVIIIVAFKRPVIQFTIFDFDMKKRLIMNTSLDKS